MGFRLGVFSLLGLEEAEAVVVAGHFGIVWPFELLSELEDILNDGFGVGVKPSPAIRLGDFLHPVESFGVAHERPFLLGSQASRWR